MILIHDSARPIERDLASVLHGWIDAGLLVTFASPEGECINARFPRKSWMAEGWFHFCVSLLFHKNSTGQFGAIVPQSSGG